MKRAIFAAFASLAFFLIASPASAHSSLQKSDPSDGAVLDAAPAQVTADYTEPPSPSNSAMGIVDECGRSADDGNTQVIGTRMQIKMTSTHAGRYTVSWSAVSLQDGHHSWGSFSFTVRGDSPCAPGKVTVVKKSAPAAKSVARPAVSKPASSPSAPSSPSSRKVILATRTGESPPPTRVDRLIASSATPRTHSSTAGLAVSLFVIVLGLAPVALERRRGGSSAR